MYSQFYNQGDFYQLLPVHRMQVAPGSSMSLALSVRWQGGKLPHRVFTGGETMLASFYVPNRLLWTDHEDDTAVGSMGSESWVKYISEGDLTEDVPLIPSGAPYLFERMAGSVSGPIFARRAHKMIQNRFFGERDHPTSFYANVFNDSDISQKRTRRLEEFKSRLVEVDEFRTEEYKAPVVTNEAVINIETLRRSLRVSRFEQREDQRGDKYVHAMKQMGVSLGWKVTNEPQVLGIKRARFNGRTTTSTGTDVGEQVSRFAGAASMRLRRKFFAEHGQVMTYLLVRPDLFSSIDTGSPDTFFRQKASFFLKAPTDTLATIGHNRFGLGAGTGLKARRRITYTEGANVLGNFSATDALVLTDTPANWEDVRYPTPVLPNGLHGSPIAACASVRANLLFPRGM